MQVKLKHLFVKVTGYWSFNYVAKNINLHTLSRIKVFGFRMSNHHYLSKRNTFVKVSIKLKLRIVTIRFP